MVLVRLLLFLALASIAVALVLYMFGRDRRYLRFIVQVIKFTIILLIANLFVFLLMWQSSGLTSQALWFIGKRR